jgi:hypothetical protein
VRRKHATRRGAVRAASDLLAAAAVACIITVALASAHQKGDFYPAYWEDNPVTWRFKQEFDAENFRDRVKDGAHAWNELAGNLRFEHLIGDASGWTATDCPGYMKNAIHIGNIDGGGNTLARTYTCYDSGGSYVFIESKQIKFDDGENWHTAGSNDVSSLEYDALGLSVHEFGHATGWHGHFAEGGELCEAGVKHTMCPVIHRGSAAWRTLEEHDRHTFNYAY